MASRGEMARRTAARAFTLIELLVVILIIAVIIAITIPALGADGGEAGRDAEPDEHDQRVGGDVRRRRAAVAGVLHRARHGEHGEREHLRHEFDGERDAGADRIAAGRRHAAGRHDRADRDDADALRVRPVRGARLGRDEAVYTPDPKYYTAQVQGTQQIQTTRLRGTPAPKATRSSSRTSWTPGGCRSSRGGRTRRR